MKLIYVFKILFWPKLWYVFHQIVNNKHMHCTHINILVFFFFFSQYMHTIFQHIYLLSCVRYHNSSLYSLQYCVLLPPFGMNFFPHLHSHNEKIKNVDRKFGGKKMILHKIFFNERWCIKWMDDISGTNTHFIHTFNGTCMASKWNGGKSVWINEYFISLIDLSVKDGWKQQPRADLLSERKKTLPQYIDNMIGENDLVRNLKILAP